MRYYGIILLIFFTQLQGEVLSLSESITKAIQTHPDIKSLLLSVKKSQSGVKVVKADYLPQVALNIEYDPIRTYVLPQNGMFHTINDSGFQAGATINQKIWDFSKTSDTIEAYKMEESIAKLSLKDAKALMAYRVKLQYELIIVYQKAIIVRKQDIESKKELYKQANSLVKLGMKTKADALRFLSSLYIAQDNLATAKANFDKARVSLSHYIGESISEDVELEDTISEDIIMDDEKSIYKTIMQNNPEFLSSKKSVKKDALLYKATQSSHYGSIDAVASYNYQNTLNEYDSTLIGVIYKIPLYSGGRTSALVQSSLLQKEKSKEILHSKELAIEEEFANLIIDLKRYKLTIKAKEAQKEAAQETKILLNARYKEGLSTYMEVLDATSLLLDAELGLLEAKYAKSTLLHRIEYLQGKIL